MKKYIFLLIAAFALISSCTKDEDKWSEVMKDTDVGAAMPYAYFTSPKVFDIADLNNTSIDFTLDVNATGRAKNWRRVVLMKSFNGGPAVQHAEYLPADMPASISITVDEALQGIEGVTKESLEGGDFFDWEFIMDVPDTLRYQAELVPTFPDFRSYFASAPVGFVIEGSYTMDLIYDDIGTADQQKTGYQIELVPGTGKSQYILEDIGGTALYNLWEVDIPYRVYYIGNNEFVLHSTSEGYAGVLSFGGTVTRNPDNGVITVEAAYERSCCGLNGVGISFTLTPEF